MYIFEYYNFKYNILIFLGNTKRIFKISRWYLFIILNKSLMKQLSKNPTIFYFCEKFFIIFYEDTIA